MLRPLNIEQRGELSLVAMNLPTLDKNLFPALLDALESINQNTNIRVVVLTGRLHVFSAGAELREVAALESVEAVDRYKSVPLRIVKILATWPKVSVAAINGHCMGGALEIALACDFRYSVDSLAGDLDTAFIGFPESRLGLVPGMGGAYLATRLIGHARALELIFTGRLICPCEAVQVGLVHRRFPREGFLDETLSLARKIVSELRTPVPLLRRAVLGASYQEDLDMAQRHESDAFRECCLRPETRESIGQALQNHRARFQHTAKLAV